MSSATSFVRFILVACLVASVFCMPPGGKGQKFKAFDFFKGEWLIPVDAEAEEYYTLALTGVNGTLSGQIFLNETGEISNQKYIKIAVEEDLNCVMSVAEYTEEAPADEDFEEFTTFSFEQAKSGLFKANIEIPGYDDAIVVAVGANAAELILLKDGEMTAVSALNKAPTRPPQSMLQRMLPAIMMSAMSFIMMRFKKQPQAAKMQAEPTAEAAGEANGEAKSSGDKKKE
ncbi:hypothetical protein J8273_7361 [Carpediemonas membranifera]|uniref:Uncharacterized protein n=1 Tax=Carpediemonas membranifera TaxID=201153 RepID=A0A8J6E1U6_9EUKA|nr:hypothetical protein J8273_7361 [Carpediemonas membranifera]|eukprot:KAG9391087.1 hypothetical protein J8273_7361 [Carpediemonas membranifera]